MIIGITLLPIVIISISVMEMGRIKKYVAFKIEKRSKYYWAVFAGVLMIIFSSLAYLLISGIFLCLSPNFSVFA